MLEVGNRSLSQLVTVYPALPRQPAGDLFPRGGGLEIVFEFFNKMLKLLVRLCSFERDLSGGKFWWPIYSLFSAKL